MPIETVGTIVLSKAGWSPKKFKLAKKDFEDVKVFDAILLKPKRRNAFTPDNSTDLIFFLDMSVLELNYKKKLFPLIAENNSNLLKEYNLKKTEKIKLPNNHLQYALTWYSLCFVIIIAFLVYRKKI